MKPARSAKLTKLALANTKNLFQFRASSVSFADRAGYYPVKREPEVSEFVVTRIPETGAEKMGDDNPVNEID